ncbi:MAG: hypothetical protein ABEJ28_09840 [Salinigranum sp.]
MTRTTRVATSRCLKCGFEAASGDAQWGTVDLGKLGTVAQCPQCSSTNIISGR